MSGDSILSGEAAAWSGGLHRALTREFAPVPIKPASASLLITLTQDPARAMADASAFAAAQPKGNPDRAVMIVLPPSPMPPSPMLEWPAIQLGATLLAFTRHAALSWAPRRVRINLISLGIDLSQPWSRPRPVTRPVPDQDVIAAIQAIRRWPCMTGQCLSLGA